MDKSYLPALCMAALEVLPAQPSDLGKVLRDRHAREALIRLSPSGLDGGELVGWLCDEIDLGRVELWHKRIDQVAREQSAGVTLIHETTYPSGLVDCWDAPPLLFVRGEIGSRTRVAVVGSRDATHATLQTAHQLASSVTAAGATVVSGLAAGVDSAAHRGALDAGGHTIAVMGTGIRKVFPLHNADLVEHIARTGAVISQFAPDAPRTGTTFLYRNSVIAGLVDVNVVMGGRERSGSRHQAEQAMRYGRRVLLWEPELGETPWAVRAVSAAEACFVSSIDQVMGCLPSIA